MKSVFTAALFAIASGAAAPDTEFARRLTGYRLRRLAGYPAPYQSDSCLDDQFHDKCWNCMCLAGGEGNPVETMRCDLDANPDGQDHCVPKLANGEQCYYDWECQSNSCLGYGDLYCAKRHRGP